MYAEYLLSGHPLSKRFIPVRFYIYRKKRCKNKWNIQIGESRRVGNDGTVYRERTVQSRKIHTALYEMILFLKILLRITHSFA